MHHVPMLELQRNYGRQGPEYFKSIRDQYGDVMTTKTPFIGTQYYLYHPDDIYHVLVKQASCFDKSRFAQRMLSGSFGNGLFLSTGDQWKQQRKLMQPQFHHVHVQKYAERMIDQAQARADEWQDSTIYNLNDEMHSLAFKIIVDILFSADASDSTDAIATAMHDLSAGLQAQTTSTVLALMPDWMPIPILRQKRHGQKMLDKMVRQRLIERRQEGEANAPHDLLTLLVFSHDEDTGETMSDQQIRDELVTLYIAGHETTALLMGWTWSLLSQYPKVEAKLHTELDTILDGKPPTLDVLPRLTYLNAIIKEVLRLYPPAWFLLRETTEDVQLPNVAIRSGALCLIIPYVNHRDGRWFDNPDDFIPERWENDFEKSLPKGAYMPFGLGSRICIGNGIAMLEAQLVLATLAQQYRIEILDKPEMTKTDLTLGFLNPVRMKVHHR